METKNWNEFEEVWISHIKQFYGLAFTPTESLSKEVYETLQKLEELVKQVRQDKEKK